MTAAMRQRVQRLDGELLLIVALLLGAGLVAAALLADLAQRCQVA